MSRKKIEINTKRIKKLRQLIERENISQAKLAKLSFHAPQSLSRIMQQKQPLTEDIATDIINAVNKETGKDYRIEWLLDLDDVMTATEYKERFLTFLDAKENAVDILLSAALDGICNFEKIDVPSVTPPEYAFLRAQVLDAVDQIALTYVKYRPYSAIWNILDKPISTDNKKDN